MIAAIAASSIAGVLGQSTAREQLARGRAFWEQRLANSAIGALEIAAAIRLRRVIAGEWMLALSGLLSCAFGLIVLAIPAAGAVAIAWTLGAYAVASGVVLTALGIKLRARVLAA